MQAKNIVIAILVIVLIGAIGFLLFGKTSDTTVVIPEDTTEVVDNQTPPVEDTTTETPPAEAVEEMEGRGDKTDLGKSVDGSTLEAYHFGEGETEVLLIGGVHGGYSPNTSDLAESLVAFYEENESDIPENVMLTIIPNLNPDGSAKSGSAGRFNANEVDLNRNFDCEWSETAVWKSQEVSGGSAPFSEPEAAALRDYVAQHEPTAAVVWFSAEGKVYPSACADTPSKKSVELAATFATAAGYPAEAEFDAYAITGDMVNWMAGEGVHAISVLLSDHQSSELNKNKAGVEAILNSYAE